MQNQTSTRIGTTSTSQQFAGSQPLIFRRKPLLNLGASRLPSNPCASQVQRCFGRLTSASALHGSHSSTNRRSVQVSAKRPGKNSRDYVDLSFMDDVEEEIERARRRGYEIKQKFASSSSEDISTKWWLVAGGTTFAALVLGPVVGAFLLAAGAVGFAFTVGFAAITAAWFIIPLFLGFGVLSTIGAFAGAFLLPAIFQLAFVAGGLALIAAALRPVLQAPSAASKGGFQARRQGETIDVEVEGPSKEEREAEELERATRREMEEFDRRLRQEKDSSRGRYTQDDLWNKK